MKRYIHIITLLLITVSLSAQTVKKGYKSLEKLDYIKAKDSFIKILETDKENVAANFGLAMVYADDNSPYFNIIDSWQYIEAIQGKENQLSQEDMEIMGEYFLNTETRRTSRPVKKKVEIAVEAVESRLIKYIREENNLEACYAVLDRYPDFKHYDNVVHIRNQFEYRKFEKLNTFDGYNEFIEKFPEAAQIPKAIKLRNKMAFEEVSAKNTVEAYNQYLFKYPDSEYTQKAIKMRNSSAFAMAKKEHTLEAYETFIEQYSDALDIPEAKKYQRELMYEKAKRIKSLEAYNKFINMYPDGGYYLDVFNLKAGDLGMQQFRQLGFDSPTFKWAKALDNNEYIDKAKAISPLKDGGYIVAGITRQSDSSFADAWIIKLDDKGQMIWNKTIGQPFEDDILEIMETTQGDIIAIGYTKISADSAAKSMGWMFRLGKDGSRIWNKNLGEMSISACAISPDDKVVLATYTNDTIPDNHFINANNLEGNKVAERDFVNAGYFNDIIFTENNTAFLAGTKWFTLTDSKYYINWEDTLGYQATIYNADLNSSGVLLQASDSNNHYLVTYNIVGSKTGQTVIPLTGNFNTVYDVLLTTNNEQLIIGEDLQNSYVAKYNASGNKVAEKLLNGNIRFRRMVKNNGDVVYLLDGEDILVIAFSSSGF